jgi:hypothetical protein
MKIKLDSEMKRALLCSALYTIGTEIGKLELSFGWGTLCAVVIITFFSMWLKGLKENKIS